MIARPWRAILRLSPSGERLRTAYAALFGLVAAMAGCRDRAATLADAAPPAPRVRLFWLRNTELSSSPRGQPIRKISDAVLVEVLPGGRVRSAAQDAHAFDGYVPEASLATPVDDEGFSLYAQRVGDLHLGTLTGPIVGRIHPGAFVSVIPSLDASLAIALPGFRSDSEGTARTVVVYADSDKLGHEPLPVQAPVVEGRLIKDIQPGLDLFPTAGDRGAPFAHPLCGDARVVAEEPGASRIAQLHAGVELLGWTAASIEMRRGPIRCSLRTVSREGGRLWLHPGPTAIERVNVVAPPDEFVRADPPARDDLLQNLINGGSVHWMTIDKKEARCREWKFESARRSVVGSERETLLEGRLTRTGTDVVDGQRLLLSFTFGYRPNVPSARRELTLGGPQWVEPGTTGKPRQAHGGSNCLLRYAFVGVTTDAFRMLPGNAPDESVVAWHRDDEEHWFWTKVSCLAEAARATAALRRDPEMQPPGGVHIDCFEED